MRSENEDSQKHEEKSFSRQVDQPGRQDGHASSLQKFWKADKRRGSEIIRDIQEGVRGRHEDIPAIKRTKSKTRVRAVSDKWIKHRLDIGRPTGARGPLDDAPGNAEAPAPVIDECHIKGALPVEDSP